MVTKGEVQKTFQNQFLGGFEEQDSQPDTFKTIELITEAISVTVLSLKIEMTYSLLQLQSSVTSYIVRYRG